ncbi:Protein T01B7.5 [Aphelenchoides besseyi]|nr:Protein T01B7.5 [Aphelenchoides besseyi]
MVWDLVTVQFVSDMTACVLGMIFNSRLIVAIFKATDQNLRSYSYLLLASALFNLFFSIVAFCTLHQLLSVSGVLVITSHGFVERFLFPHVGSLLMIPHVFASNHGLLILVVQYKYRYRIVSGHTFSTQNDGTTVEEDTDDVYDEVDRHHNSLDADLVVDSNRRRRITRQHELMPIVQQLSDSEVYDQEEENEVEREEALPNANEWGKKRKMFYVDSTTKIREDGFLNDEEQEALELEEEDAIRRQRRSDLSHSFVNINKLSALVENSDEEAEVPKTIEFADNVQSTVKTLEQLRQQNSKPVVKPTVKSIQKPTIVESKRPEISDHIEGWETTDEEENVEEVDRREINYENKGIKLKKRKKGTEHSRIKRRHQYQKALIKRRSQVPDVKRELTKYSGETRGIRASTVRSIPLR